MSVSQRDRIQGMFLGIAIGDQLYMPVETFSAEKIAREHGRITDYLLPPYVHKWFRGVTHPRWTDDTQLTLAVAESLIASKGLDMENMAAWHVKSLQEGNLGFGKSTLNSIERLKEGCDWRMSGEPNGSGNGVVMKIAPLAAYIMYIPQYTPHNTSSVNRAILQFSAMTHGSLMAYESALAHVDILGRCLYLNPQENIPEGENWWDYKFRRWGRWINKSIEESLNEVSGSREYGNLTISFEARLLHERITALSALPILDLTNQEIIKLFEKGTCYVYNSLPFCYAFFLRNPFSIETLYDVGNAGGDTDTNASIVSGLIGALNGTNIFPNHLVRGLWQAERIIDTANRFCDAFGIKE